MRHLVSRSSSFLLFLLWTESSHPRLFSPLPLIRSNLSTHASRAELYIHRRRFDVNSSLAQATRPDFSFSFEVIAAREAPRCLFSTFSISREDNVSRYAGECVYIHLDTQCRQRSTDRGGGVVFGTSSDLALLRTGEEGKNPSCLKNKKKSVKHSIYLGLLSILSRDFHTPARQQQSLTPFIYTRVHTSPGMGVQMKMPTGASLCMCRRVFRDVWLRAV